MGYSWLIDERRVPEYILQEQDYTNKMAGRLTPGVTPMVLYCAQGRTVTTLSEPNQLS